MQMAKSGARNLVLLSRRSLNAARVASLQGIPLKYSPAVKIHVIQCDFSERAAVMSMAGQLEDLSLPAVKGILQSATILQDQILERMSAKDWQTPLLTQDAWNSTFSSCSLH